MSKLELEIRSYIIIFGLVFMVVFLSGCQMSNRNVGAAIGGGAGGLIGATVGGGKGQIMATGAGAAIGAVVGSKIGDSMDEKK